MKHDNPRTDLVCCDIDVAKNRRSISGRVKMSGQKNLAEISDKFDSSRRRVSVTLPSICPNSLASNVAREALYPTVILSHRV